jgi:hypothetical protein
MSEFRDRIPDLQKIVKRILNDYHGTNKNEKYWWFLSGFFSCFIWRMIQVSRLNSLDWSVIIEKGRVDEVFYFDLHQRIASSRSVKYFHNFTNYVDPYPEGNEGIDFSNLMDENDENLHKKNAHTYTPLPINIILIGNIINKIINKLSPKKTFSIDLVDTEDELYIFEMLFANLAPKTLFESYPSWWQPIAFLLAFYKRNKIYKIYNGYEVTIYDKMIQAKIFSARDGIKQFLIPNHGFSNTFAIDQIFHNSVGYHPYRSHINNDYGQLSLAKKKKGIQKFDILLISPSSKFYELEYMSLKEYGNYELWYKNYLKKILDNNNRGLKINIRFKDRFRHNQFESSFIEEKRAFEDCYHEYKLIISPYTSTIVGKCIFAKIRFLSYDPLLYVYDLNLKNQLHNLSHGNIIFNSHEFETKTLEIVR